MMKVLKWIYKLGYESGYRDCEEDFSAKARREAQEADFLKEFSSNWGEK